MAKWISYTGPYPDLLILNEVGTQPIEDGYKMDQTHITHLKIGNLMGNIGKETHS